MAYTSYIFPIQPNEVTWKKYLYNRETASTTAASQFMIEYSHKPKENAFKVFSWSKASEGQWLGAASNF